MTPKLKYNCPENWHTMKVGLLSRYCDNCNKEVYDFTKMTREEIILYFLEHGNQKVCARIFPSQVDSHEEKLIVIERLLQKHRNSNLAFYLLTIGSLTLLACSNNQKDYTSTSKFDTRIQIDSVSDNCTNSKSENKNYQSNTSDKSRTIISEIITGELMFEELEMNVDDPVPLAEVMPEFVGGLDSLTSFLKSNLKYPEWETRNEIEGTTFVSFVVDTIGEVKSPEIIKTVNGSKNFDAETLRVMSTMPPWIPGKQAGKKIEVKMVLPVKFKL